MPFTTFLDSAARLFSSSFADREAVKRYQSRRLRRLVRYAGEHVPYYRRRFEQVGLDLERFRGLEDLAALPISSKDDLFDCRPEDLISRKVAADRLYARTTSGSTGRPFTVRCSWWEERFLSALRMQAYWRMGIGPRDKTAQIRFRGRAAGVERGLSFLRRLGLFRTVLLDSSLDPRDIARRLEPLRPDVIRGYANLTSLVADAVLAQDLIVRPRLITVGGDILTAGMRRRISEAFRAPVRETYGSHEFNLLAWECPDSGVLHVCEEGIVLEVVNDGHPVAVGERGEVVATALHSFAQPFIRFRLGDLVTRGAESCRCGLPYSTIRSIEGRIYDRIILPDGRAASPGDVLTHLERSFDWLQQYQLVQVSQALVVLRLVPKSEPPPADLRAVHRLMNEFLGPGVEHRVDLLTAIPLAPGEKYRASMSRVFSNYDDSTQ